MVARDAETRHLLERRTAVRYGGTVFHTSRRHLALLAGLVSTTACFDRPPRPRDASEPTALEQPASATDPAASPTAAAASAGEQVPARPTARPSEPPPENPPGFPGTLPNLRWLERRKLSAHVTCSPECAALPLDAQHPAPVAMWTEDLESAPHRFERDLRLDVYGIVLRGRAVLHDHGYGTDYELGPWMAFHAPGAGISLTAGQPWPRLVVALVSNGTSMRAITRRKPRPWALRPGKIRLVDMQEVDDLSWAGGQAHARIGFESGRASFGLLSTGPRVPVLPHTHADGWEVVGLLAADGELRLGASAENLGSAEAAPQERRTLVDGDVGAIPPRTKHTWMPSGDKVLFAVQLFAPPGPEQRFKKLADDAVSSR